MIIILNVSYYAFFIFCSIIMKEHHINAYSTFIQIYVMLRWGDFCKTKYCDYYHFKVTKQMAEKNKEKEELKSPFKYRIVPIPSFLSEILLKQKKEMHLTYRLSLDELEKLPIVIPSINEYEDYCLANNLYLKSKKALKQGAEISEKIISYTESDKTEATDLNSYNGDFYLSNFKFHALNDAMMTTGEVAYILGLAPVDTFSRHYCDYTNPFIQKMLVEKLNDWFSLYKDWDGKPQFESGTTKSELMLS